MPYVELIRRDPVIARAFLTAVVVTTPAFDQLYRSALGSIDPAFQRDLVDAWLAEDLIASRREIFLAWQRELDSGDQPAR